MPAPTAFDEALLWFLNRIILSDAAQKKLDAAAKLAAFWVADLAQVRLVDDVFKSLRRAVQRGEDLKAWKKRVGPSIRDAWHLSKDKQPQRLEVIYRNAMQHSYNQGRYEQMKEVADVRPMWMYDAIMDSRTSPICRPRDHVIKPHDDPWWESNYPPLHHQCRSSVRCLTERKAQQRYGGGKTPPADLKDPTPGFGHAPTLQPKQPRHDNVSPELKRESEKKKATKQPKPKQQHAAKPATAVKPTSKPAVD